VNFNLLQAYLSPIVDDNSDQGWEELTMASMEHLLRTSLAAVASDQATVPYLKVPDDTSRLKKQITVVCDRLAKGGKLYPF
jgi:Bardet-Biedl syndrome 9 protein